VQGRAPRSPIGLGSKLAGLVAALALCAGAAPAQDPTPPLAAEPAAKPEERAPQAIPIPEIAIRSEQVTTLLRTIEAGLPDPPGDQLGVLRAKIQDRNRVNHEYSF